jgi:glycosyltransferase involved in cell wall biosynthesis
MRVRDAAMKISSKPRPIAQKARVNAQPQTIKVAHVVGQMAVGGMEKLLVEFARHADRSRFELSFVSLGERGPVAAEIEALGWPVVAMGEASGFRPSMIFALAGLFRRGRVDVVHTHNGRPLMYGGPAARVAGARASIHTRHGQQHGASRRELARFRLATRLVDRVVCVSADAMRLAAARGVAVEKLRPVVNGVDLTRFGYAGPRADGPAVMIGRLSPEKDAQNLVRAVALVVAEERRFRLQVAGDGVCMATLVALTRELGLTDHVAFLGEVKDVAALLASASMFVLPSLTEGISLTLLEAMARGLPVVATRVGGTPEVVEDGTSGLLVAAQSPAELSQAMLRVYRQPHRARLMGLAAHHRASALFDVRRMVAEYEELYLECIGEKRADALAA